jgi:hypothetical protein
MKTLVTIVVVRWVVVVLVVLVVVVIKVAEMCDGGVRRLKIVYLVGHGRAAGIVPPK